MASEWIKLCHDTPRKPEIAKIARLSKLHVDEAFGVVMRFWLWVDWVSVDGELPGVTIEDCHALVTPEARHKRVIEALIEVGWLGLNKENNSLFVPNFERHNGDSAKSRALSSDRKRKERTESGHANVTKMSRSQRDKSVTREELDKKEGRKEAASPLKPNAVETIMDLEWTMVDGSVQSLTKEAIDDLAVIFQNIDLDFGIRNAWSHYRRVQPHERPRDLQACLISWFRHHRETPQGRRELQKQYEPKPREHYSGFKDAASVDEAEAYIKALGGAK
jgi:hypothetical protein